MLESSIVRLSATTGCMDWPPNNIGGTLCTLSELGVLPIVLQWGEANSSSCRSCMYCLIRSIVLAMAPEACTKWVRAFEQEDCRAESNLRARASPPLLIRYKKHKMFIMGMWKADLSTHKSTRLKMSTNNQVKLPRINK